MNENNPSDEKAELSDDDFLNGLAENATGRNVWFIDMNVTASPAILAGILGKRNVSTIHQMRQEGKLPANTGASYAECIQHHVRFWQEKSLKKSNNLAEEALRQKIKLDAAKTEREWLNIAKEKKQLMDVQELALVFEPYFSRLRGQLVAITRKFPESQQDIDAVLNTWKAIGEEMKSRAEKFLIDYVDRKINEDFNSPGLDDE